MSCLKAIKSTFVWQIPSISNTHKVMLCNGYTIMNFNKYITFPIVELIAKYFTNDSFTLQDIKECEPKKCFMSPIFSLCSFKWYLEIWGNGSNDRSKGSVVLFLCLASCPNKITGIQTSFTLSLKEMDNICCNRQFKFTPKKYYCRWRRNILSSKCIENMKQLTFVVELYIMDILDKEGNNVYNEYLNKYNIINTKPIQLPMVRYKWCVIDKLDANSFGYCFSKAYQYGAFKWYLKFGHFEDGTWIVLTIKPFPTGIHAICVNYTFYAQELDKKFKRTKAKFDIDHLSKGWRISNEKYREKIKQLNELNIYLNFIIYEAYDKNNDVIPNYIENMNTLKNKELSSAKYQWSISENETLKNIKTAGVGQEFKSGIFVIADLKWYISIYSNGDQTENEGKFMVILNLFAWPPMLSKVICNIKITFDELNDNAYDSLTMYKPWYPSYKLSNFDEIKDLENITITFQLTTLSVYDKNENVITNYIDKYAFKPLHDLTTIDYEWKITDKNTMNEIKIGRHVFGFASKPFRGYGQIWYLTIYPNGSRYSRNTINIFLNWISMTDTIVIQYELEWVESDKICRSINAYSTDRDSAGWINWPLSIQDVQHLNTMTIRVKIKLIDIYENGIINTQKYLKENMVKEIELLPSRTYKWHITKAILSKIKKTYKKGVSYTSHVFQVYGINWYLDFFPFGKSVDKDEGSTICINIVSLPSINAIVNIRCTLIIHELDINAITSYRFTKNQLFVSWGPQRMSLPQLHSLEQCTIELQMELIDIFDGNDNITHRYMRVDDDDDDNKGDLQMMIDRMNVFNQLELEQDNDCNIDGDIDMNNYQHFEDDEFKEWLFNQVKLPKYYDIFKNNNIDNLTMIKLININHLDELKISNLSDQLQILIEIANINII